MPLEDIPNQPRVFETGYDYGKGVHYNRGCSQHNLARDLGLVCVLSM